MAALQLALVHVVEPANGMLANTPAQALAKASVLHAPAVVKVRITLAKPY